MNITLEQLRFAVQRCTPGAPPSYAERLWRELRQVCECDAGGNVPHEQHSQHHRDLIGGIPGQPFGGSVIR